MNIFKSIGSVLATTDSVILKGGTVIQHSLASVESFAQLSNVISANYAQSIVAEQMATMVTKGTTEEDAHTYFANLVDLETTSSIVPPLKTKD